MVRLAEELILEQQEEWRLDGRRVSSKHSMAKLVNTSDRFQDQQTPDLAAAPCSPRSAQRIVRGLHVTPREANIIKIFCI